MISGALQKFRGPQRGQREAMNSEGAIGMGCSLKVTLNILKLMAKSININKRII